MHLDIKSEEGFAELLVERFQTEFSKRDRSGIYGLTQRAMTYNSNRIEGSTLTEEHTASLFETGIISPGDEIVRTKDLEEANGHFAMFNYLLKTLDRPLSEEIIKKFHYLLKYGVFEDMLNGYPIGEYKNRRNIVGNINTALPENVEKEMQALLQEYNVIKRHTIEEIALFHVKYETIHPFQDGNGRTGRMIAFRECLVSRIMPFIVQDKNKNQYYVALNHYHSSGQPDELIDFFMLEQDSYFSLAMDMVLPFSQKRIEDRIGEQLEILNRKKKN